ncbi:MAG: putative Zn-dependent protease, partial [Gammaproteobacteria bacterium]
MRLDWSGIRHVVLTASIAYCALSTPSQAQSISGDVAGFYEDALVRFENGDSVGAALQLKNVLQAQADHRAARILLGRIYLKEGAAEAAEEQFLQARALGADESLLVLPLAEAFLRQHKYDDVITKILYSGYRPSIDYR